MKSVFEASTGIEAHMIKNLLQMNDIDSEVFGEHLQGGVGDLQAIGVVRVMVADGDYESAQAVIREWESLPSNVESEGDENSRRHGGFGSAIFGFILGVIAVMALTQSAVEVDGIDYNDDGELDERWEYVNNTIRAVRVDRNRDREFDLVFSYDLHGKLSSLEEDNDFDGRFEFKCRYRAGNLLTCRSDTENDGFYEYRQRYTDGVLATASFYDPESRLLKKRQYFKQQRLVMSEIDANNDGKLDTQVSYDQFESPI